MKLACGFALHQNRPGAALNNFASLFAEGDFEGDAAIFEAGEGL
jgi:hypothetical protein